MSYFAPEEIQKFNFFHVILQECMQKSEENGLVS